MRHILAPVKFGDGMQALRAQNIGIYLEVGPGAALLRMGRRCVAANGEEWLASLRPPREDWQQMLDSLARLYVQGVPVDWAALDAGTTRDRLPLPTYPFQRQRYWFSEADQITIAPPIQLATQELSSYDPWLGNAMCTASGEVLFMQRYTSATPFSLQDHRLYGQIFLPAASHVATAIKAAERLFGDGIYVLDELDFSEALELREDGHTLIQYAFGPAPNGTYSWRAFSRSSNDTNSRERWKPHASGRIAVAQTPAAENLSREAITALIERCTETLDGAALYDRFAELGYNYGPTFRGIGQLWWNSTEAIAQITVDQRSSETLLASPGVLDSCFQSSLFAALVPTVAGGDHLYIPAGLDRIEVYGRATGSLWCRCTVRKTKPSIATADISVYGEAGELVARITGLRARRVPKALLGERVLRENWFYQIDWVRQPLPPLPQRGRAGESYVIFADGGGVGDSLARRLEAEGHRCARIYAGEKRQQVDLRYYIDPACRGDYTWALKEIACRDGALGTLVNLWPLDAAPVETITAPRLAAEQRMVCGGVLDVIHALAGVGLPQPSDLWVVTAGAQAVGDDTPLTGLVASSLWGLGRVFDLEHRDQRMTRVDLDSAVSDPETHAMHLLTELRANTRESQVAYRSGMRHIARLAHAESSRAPLLTSPLIRQNATYLISGGLGSLGLVCARWLVTQGARHVALLGRHPPTVAASVKLDELRQLGARIDAHRRRRDGRYLRFRGIKLARCDLAAACWRDPCCRQFEGWFAHAAGVGRF